MKKRISSLLLAFCLCVSLLTVAAGATDATPTVGGSYTSGVVTITGSGFPAETQYSMIAVKDGSDNLIALGSATTDANGAISNTSITTGAISSPNSCKVYVYNDIGGTVVASGNVTATGGSGGGGGGGGSTSSGDSTSASVSGTTDSSGKTTASITTGTVNTLVEAAKKAAAKGESPVVEIQLKTTGDTKSASLAIPAAALSNLANNTNAPVKVDAGIAAVAFDADAVDAISSAAGSKDVSISVATVDPSTLTTVAQQLVGSRPVYNFTVTAGDSTISSFGSGSAAVSIPYTPGASEDLNAIVVYYVDASGALQTVRGAYNNQTKSVEFVTSHFSQYAVGYNKVSFADVSTGAWYYAPVTFSAARGITTGTTATTFSPSAMVTRGQFVVMLLRAYEIEPANSSSNNFADAGNTYYTGYLATAKAMGISNGVGNNQFAPEKGITREEMFTMLYRALDKLGELPEATTGKTLSSFNDGVSVSDYAKDAMTALVKGGVVAGSDGKLNPQGQSTRAEMVQVLYNLLSK